MIAVAERAGMAIRWRESQLRRREVAGAATWVLDVLRSFAAMQQRVCSVPLVLLLLVAACWVSQARATTAIAPAYVIASQVDTSGQPPVLTRRERRWRRRIARYKTKQAAGGGPAAGEGLLVTGGVLAGVGLLTLLLGAGLSGGSVVGAIVGFPVLLLGGLLSLAGVILLLTGLAARAKPPRRILPPAPSPEAGPG